VTLSYGSELYLYGRQKGPGKSPRFVLGKVSRPVGSYLRRDTFGVGLRPEMRPQEEVVQGNIWGGLSGRKFSKEIYPGECSEEMPRG